MTRSSTYGFWVACWGLAAVVGCGPLERTGAATGTITSEGAIASAQRAITDGELTDAYRSVGLLQAGISGSVGICSGTLIGERTVLTAAHCIELGRTHVFHLEGARYAVSRVIQHEAWDPKNPRFPNDLGLAILTRRPDVEPSAIALSSPQTGTPLTLVGFGATAEGQNDAGTKRVTSNRISEVTPLRFAYAGTGGGMGNTCNGDSGGPAYAWVDGKLYQVGITSAGVAPCGTLAWDTRVDVFRDWITANAAGDVFHHDVQAPQVVISAPLTGGEVASRITVVADATDDARVTTVALRVAGREVQRATAPPYRFTIDLSPGPQTIEVVAWDEAGNEGTAAVHVAAGPGLAGAFGAQCRADSDCESALCATATIDPRGGGTARRTCTHACGYDGDCPAGARCGLDDLGRAACVAATLLSAEGMPEGQTAGCALVGAPAPPPPLLLLLLALSLLLRRRTR